MRYPVILSLVVALGLLTLVGCQESDSSQIQKARLVGNENIKLKQEIKAKDKEIETLKAEIVRLKQENAKIQEDAGNANIKVLQMMTASEKNAEMIAEENKKLKEEIKKLKGQ